MCLINEKKSNIKEIIGYAVVCKLYIGDTYASLFGPREEYSKNKRYTAENAPIDYRIPYPKSIKIPGFHGFYNIKDANEYAWKFCHRIVKCRFENIISTGHVRFEYKDLNIKAYRAKHRTILEEVQ